MGGEESAKVRPYWHVDAKWIASVLLFVVLSVTLLVYGLVRATDEKPAKEALTMTLALAFSPNGLDDPRDVESFRQRLEADPKVEIQPVSGLRITVSKSDIQGLSPKQARLRFFSKLADVIYSKGPQGLADLASTREVKEGIAGGLGPMSIFTSASHDSIARLLAGLLAITLFLLIGVVYFSHRFGRFASPGFVLIAAGFPGAVLFAIVSKGLKNGGPKSAATGGPSLDAIVSSVAPPLLQTASQPYVVSLIAGILLLGIAFVGSLTSRLLKLKKKARVCP